MPTIYGATCLDLFAGSGALGFEALSRGASQVVMCDTAPAVIKALMQNADALQLHYSRWSPHTPQENQPPLLLFEGDLTQQPSTKSPLTSDQPFDIVFLDPPFTNPSALEHSIYWLNTMPHLSPEALIYIECKRGLALPIPDSWALHRHKETAHVQYSLYRTHPPRQSAPNA